MSLSRIVFGTCLLAIAGTFLSVCILAGAEYRLYAIIVSAVFLCLWGSMTYFAKSRFSIYRSYWIICAAIAIASYVVLFGPTTFYVETSPGVFYSDKEYQTQEFDVKGKNLYQHPWLIYKLYVSIFTEMRKTVKKREFDPIVIGPALLSLTLPAALFVSLYHCWKPIRKTPNNLK